MLSPVYELKAMSSFPFKGNLLNVISFIYINDVTDIMTHFFLYINSFCGQSADRLSCHGFQQAWPRCSWPCKVSPMSHWKHMLHSVESCYLAFFFPFFSFPSTKRSWAQSFKGWCINKENGCACLIWKQIHRAICIDCKSENNNHTALLWKPWLKRLVITKILAWCCSVF